MTHLSVSCLVSKSLSCASLTSGLDHHETRGKYAAYVDKLYPSSSFTQLHTT